MYLSYQNKYVSWWKLWNVIKLWLRLIWGIFESYFTCSFEEVYGGFPLILWLTFRACALVIKIDKGNNDLVIHYLQKKGDSAVLKDSSAILLIQTHNGFIWYFPVHVNQYYLCESRGQRWQISCLQMLLLLINWDKNLNIGSCLFWIFLKVHSFTFEPYAANCLRHELHHDAFMRSWDAGINFQGIFLMGQNTFQDNPFCCLIITDTKLDNPKHHKKNNWLCLMTSI